MADNVTEQLRDAATKMRGLLDDPFATPREEHKQETQATPEPEPEVEQNSEVEPEGETLEAEAETADAEPSKEAESESGAEAEAESIELGADEFASLLGLDEDRVNVSDEGKISFKVRVDGEEFDANLSEVIDAYQRDANLTNRSKKIAEIEKQRTSELEAFKETANKQAQTAAVVLEALHHAYITDVNGANLDQLKAEDPAAWSVKVTELNQKKQQLDHLVTQTLAELENQQKAIEAETQKQMAERMANEEQQTVKAFKDLGIKVDETLDKGITEYLSGIFRKEEMGKLLDHRLLVMAYKASQYDQGLKKAQSKEVKKIPKVIKKGQKPSAQAVKLDAEKKAMENFRKGGGKVEDAAALLKQRLSH